jgi:hypothetical protein
MTKRTRRWARTVKIATKSKAALHELVPTPACLNESSVFLRDREKLSVPFFVKEYVEKTMIGKY